MVKQKHTYFSIVILVLICAMMLVACGRRGQPVAPKGSVYPTSYVVKGIN